MPNTKSRRTITTEDLMASDNLRRIWERRKREWKHMTQEWIAGEYGCTQGLISQYMSRRTAIGPVATLKFARILKVQPKQIRPDFSLTMISDDLTPEAVEFAYKWLSLPKRFRDNMLRNVDDLLSATDGGEEHRDKSMAKGHHKPQPKAQ